MVCRTQDKDWKTNKHMGCANTHVLPIAKFGKLEANSNADRIVADTHGCLYSHFDAEVMGFEIRLSFVVSLRPTGPAFGQADPTRLVLVQWTVLHGMPSIFHPYGWESKPTPHYYCEANIL